MLLIQQPDAPFAPKEHRRPSTCDPSSAAEAAAIKMSVR